MLTSGLQRIVVGMKLICQIVEVRPYSLIVSLPDQLLGHVPITHISRQLTEALETSVEDDEDDIDEVEKDTIPELSDLFIRGQFLRAVVSAVRPQGTTDSRISTHLKDNVEKSSRRVELSLIPDQVNSGVSKSDLTRGLVSFIRIIII